MSASCGLTMVYFIVCELARLVISTSLSSPTQSLFSNALSITLAFSSTRCRKRILPNTLPCSRFAA